MSESDTDSLSGLSSRELEEDSNSDEEDDHVDLGDSVMEAEFNVSEPVLPVTYISWFEIRSSSSDVDEEGDDGDYVMEAEPNVS